MRFLVIGAHAVIRYGYMRATEDVDLMANNEERGAWQRLVSELGYRLEHDGGTFLQLSPPAGVGWDLDIMFVPAATFEQMFQQAKATEIDGTPVRIPALEHLLAMKLHALKHGQGLRTIKDMEDVIQLVRRNGVDVQSETFRRLCEKQADLRLYEQILRACLP